MEGLGTYTNFGKPGENRLWLDCMISLWTAPRCALHGAATFERLKTRESGNHWFARVIVAAGS